jgi:hypothetical protein
MTSPFDERNASRKQQRAEQKPVLMVPAPDATQIGILSCPPMAPEELLLLRERRLR